MTEQAPSHHRVILPESVLQGVVRSLVRTPSQVLLHRVGLNATDEVWEWLVQPAGATGAPPEGPSVLLTSQPAVQPLVGGLPLALVHLPRQGPPSARIAGANGNMADAAVRILGAGLPERAAGRPVGPASGTEPVAERWSRVAGALGGRLWRRLRTLRFVLVGCGRTGSLLATTLIRMGVRDLALVDPDTVESSTLDGAGYLPQDLGAPKAEALARHLRAANPGALVTPCAASVTSLAALAAIKRCDILVCAPDNDGARWACGLLAARYLRPLLDLGVGVFASLAAPAPPSDGPSMGAEVRLIVPGSEAGPCLACLGGVANPEHVAAMFRSATDERRFQEQRVWHRERAGSLRFLSELAVGHGLALLFGFLSGRVAGSTWLRIEFDAEGIPAVRRMPTESGAACPVCATLGYGDGA